MRAVVDLGGTIIKVGLVNDGVLSKLVPIDTEAGAGIRKNLDRAAGLIRTEYTGKIELMGIAVPGIVDIEKRTITSANAKYADAVGFDFQKWCLDEFGCPLVMDNDANAALIGEASRGCAKGEDNVVMMILGTGIGTAAIMNGRPIRGKHFQAGILGGHFVADINGEECTCGGRGCLETIAGSRELGRSVSRIEGYSGSKLSKLDHIGMKEIIDCMIYGDSFSRIAFEMVIDAYSAGITNLVHAYDPEAIVLSGGVMKGKDHILPAIIRGVQGRAWTPWGNLRFLVADDPDSSVLLGLQTLMEEWKDGS
ncbi:ROK family protein [Youngiibacter multivorans]|uniref:Glucokinase n=1 Tax=Youngiibacter multivorans TaxID=937251 RepID=A0ABS4G479_9CLOT|nr:ROK family protein [Youngiibacter multivorans]MBP1919349.1 glucokinase [Youngiibacter multivorans]